MPLLSLQIIFFISCFQDKDNSPKPKAKHCRSIKFFTCKNICCSNNTLVRAAPKSSVSTSVSTMESISFRMSSTSSIVYVSSKSLRRSNISTEPSGGWEGFIPPSPGIGVSVMRVKREIGDLLLLAPYPGNWKTWRRLWLKSWVLRVWDFAILGKFCTSSCSLKLFNAT